MKLSSRAIKEKALKIRSFKKKKKKKKNPYKKNLKKIIIIIIIIMMYENPPTCHVIEEFLENILIAENALLGLLPIGNVGEDAKRLLLNLRGMLSF